MAGLGTAAETDNIKSTIHQIHPDAERVLIKARQTFKKGRLDEALSAVREFLGMEPDYSEGLLLHAQVLEALGKEGESRTVFERLLKTHSECSEVHREYGRYLIACDHPPALAESQLLRCLTINPQDAFAHTLLADVYYRTDRKQQALLHLEIAARYPSDDPRYYRWYVEVLMKLKDFSDTTRRLQRILLFDSPSKMARSQFKKALRAKQRQRFRFRLRRVWS